MAHEIRLAGPWHYRADGSDQQERCTLPFDSAQIDSSAEQIQLSRRFHRPTGLEPRSRVVIRLECSAQPNRVMINDTAIPIESAIPSDIRTVCDADITDQLNQFNVLTLTVSRTTAVTSVRLRIIEPSS